MCERVDVAECRICEMAGINKKCPSADRWRGENRCYAGTTHHEAIEWFKRLGYTVEPGPGLTEVTLVNDRRPDFVAHVVVPGEKLAPMADLSQIITAQQLFRPGRRDH